MAVAPPSLMAPPPAVMAPPSSVMVCVHQSCPFFSQGPASISHGPPQQSWASPSSVMAPPSSVMALPFIPYGLSPSSHGPTSSVMVSVHQSSPLLQSWPLPSPQIPPSSLSIPPPSVMALPSSHGPASISFSWPFPTDSPQPLVWTSESDKLQEDPAGSCCPKVGGITGRGSSVSAARAQGLEPAADV